jgi:hypothetical protein
MASAAIAALGNPAEAIAAKIRSFIRSCRQPTLLEPGDPEISLTPETHSVSAKGPWVLLEAWDQERMISRRISSIKTEERGRLQLVTHRLGGKPGLLVLLDAYRPANDGLRRKGTRLVFGQLFRDMLQRQFAGWRVTELSTEANLEESLSPAFPRALVRRGSKGWAAMAAPPFSDIDAMLSFALIWLDYLRRREPRLSIEGLVVFLPHGRERTTCLRLLHLDRSLAQYVAATYDDEGHATTVDLSDAGNLDTQVIATPAPETARLEPEALIEAQVRSQLEALDARLRPSPVYGQVVSFAGMGHGILDLLALDLDNRLTVIELKASECIHLPLQALDYWMRVKWHLDRGELAALFPGIELSGAPPRLTLVAPALRFHSTTERILRYLRPDIQVECIGLAQSWGGPVRVMFRHHRPSG